MRAVALILVLAACGDGSTNGAVPDRVGVPEAHAPGSAIAASVALAVDHVTLLEPNATVGERLADSNAFARGVKQIATMVTDYDTAHTGTLPADLDVFVVGRKDGLRLWVVGPSGDLVIPGLEQAAAQQVKLGVRDGDVGLIITLARNKGPNRSPYFPGAWKAAGSGAGSAVAVDTVIDTVWPR